MSRPSDSLAVLPSNHADLRIGAHRCPVGEALRRVFALLDREGIPYCVTHGYEGLARRVDSDVDVVVPSQVLPGALATLLLRHRAELGATIVDWRRSADSHYVVLAVGEADETPRFLHLHVNGTYALNRRTFFTAGELLQGRVRQDWLWTPAPAMEFICLLLRRVVKNNAGVEDLEKLNELRHEDSAGCATRLSRWVSDPDATTLLRCVQNADTSSFRSIARRLRRGLLRKANLRHPGSLMKRLASSMVRKTAKFFRRDAGLDLVLLGPDGVGKSSLAAALRERWSECFPETLRRSFPPALRGRNSNTCTRTSPHADRPRPWASSVARALLYWFPHGTVGQYFGLRLRLLRSHFAVHDRHFMDNFVDPKRYRYAGPAWLLEALWSFMPKPDLVLVLDAPAEVVQARKAEVPPDETARQLRAYRALARSLPNAHVIDADQSPEDVAAEADSIIRRFLERRVARRFGKEAR